MFRQDEIKTETYKLVRKQIASEKLSRTRTAKYEKQENKCNSPYIKTELCKNCACYFIRISNTLTVRHQKFSNNNVLIVKSDSCCL